MHNELNKLKEMIAQNLKGVLQLEIDNLAKELIKYYQPRILEENGQLNTEEQDKLNSGKYNRVLESLSKEKRLNAELQKEIERLKDENCHDYHCMCLIQQENTELQKQVEQLLEERVTINKDYLQECEEHLKTVQIVKELQKQVEAWKLKAKELEEAWEISSKNEVELSKSNDSKLVKILKLQEQMDELMSIFVKERKETAKEIFTEISESDILVINTQEYGEIEVVPMERLREIVKSKCVEVE